MTVLAGTDVWLRSEIGMSTNYFSTMTYQLSFLSTTALRVVITGLSELASTTATRRMFGEGTSPSPSFPALHARKTRINRTSLFEF